MKNSRYLATCLLFLLIFLVLSSPALAQDSTVTPEPSPTAEEKTENETHEEQLAKTFDTIQNLNAEISETRKLLKREHDEQSKEKLKEFLDEQSSRLSMLEQNFMEIATEVNVPKHESIQELKKLSWTDELNQIVTPVLSELKNVINEPRELDRLQGEIDKLRERKLTLTKGIANIKSRIDLAKENKPLRQYLTTLREQWDQNLSDTNTQLTIASQRLDTRLKNKRSFTTTIEQLFQLFFKKRGRNVLITLLSCALFWVASGKISEMILNYSLSRTKKQAERKRVIEVLLHIVRTFCTAALMLGLFYLLSDWLLLVLGLMILLGVGWASKSTLPLMWKQITYFMNLGSVKEGERLMYHGLPWKVTKLYYYSRLENPLLKGGTIRLPLRDLTSMTSRPYDKDEPWFPTKEHDWILIDGSPWKVVFQSPEIVRIIQPGGAWKSISTPEFFLMNPTVISKGFRIARSFGIDYRYQSEVTNRCIDIFKDGIEKKFTNDGIDLNDITVNVEFEEAGGSSLNFAIIVDFHGDHAGSYMRLYRSLHRYCVDICNEQSWEIPFEQLTLHYHGNTTTENLSAPSQ